MGDKIKITICTGTHCFVMGGSDLLLLDECLPRRLKRSIPKHEIVTVPEAGWAGKSNGELLTLAAVDFEQRAASIVTRRDEHALAAQHGVGGVDVVARLPRETPTAPAPTPRASPALANFCALSSTAMRVGKSVRPPSPPCKRTYHHQIKGVR